jgi:hypothetical protein
VQWENSGNTPTKNMTTRGQFAMLHQRLSRGYHFPDLDEKGKETKTPSALHGFMAPHGTSVSTAYLDIPVASATDIGSKVYLYAWGWARYRDIFQDSTLHTTRFCFEVTQILIQGSDVSIVAAHCDENNCMDEECSEGAR